MDRLTQAKATSNRRERPTLPPPHQPSRLTQSNFCTRHTAGEIRVHRCPFKGLAETAPRIVCVIHRALISGAFAGLCAQLEVERPDAFVEPDLCVVRLRRRAAAPAVER
jgi:predicted ArsR family transcriptional regulator